MKRKVGFVIVLSAVALAAVAWTSTPCGLRQKCAPARCAAVCEGPQQCPYAADQGCDTTCCRRQCVAPCGERRCDPQVCPVCPDSCRKVCVGEQRQERRGGRSGRCCRW
ncbi:MAG TPA: hypothetical protein IAA13_06445 [Candidatus Alistipes merdigallinarum]|nr:hypothetical protein [Candidatus Alistipes merdigallinarum]